MHNNQVAIIGMAGLFPDAANIQAFEHNLRRGADSVRELSPLRRALTGIDSHEDYQVTGFVERLDAFDYRFFNLSKREAEQMDPAHRKLLELSCKAIWDAGYSLQELSGTNTGVYIGGKAFPKYLLEIDEPDAMAYSGNLGALVAGRISYHLNLHGPSLMIDTSCSSSLVAIHEACQKLLNGEMDIALAGGFGYITNFHRKGGNNSLGVMSAGGRCRAFDNEADGIGIGEGGGMIVLKPLQLALRHGDHVHAVILGSAVNHDGRRSNGLTAPSPKAQTEVIVKAWNRAGISPESLSFVEAHGTGTLLGDPIEFKGLSDAFSQFTKLQSFCAVSSVKSNIGHLDNAAGMASLVKSVLSLKSRCLYPSLYFTKLNAHIESANSAIFINDQLREIGPDIHPLRGGINAFGLSGTNVHMVLEGSPLNERRSIGRPVPRLVKISARTHELAEEYKQAVSSFILKERLSPEDVAFSLNCGRDDFEYRSCIVTHGSVAAEELCERLATASIRRAVEKVNVILLFADANVSLKDLLRLADQNQAFGVFFTEITRSHPQNSQDERLLSFILQVGLYRVCESLKVPIASVIATGTGRIAKQVVLGEISLDEGIRALREHSAKNPPFNPGKLSSLIEAELQDNSVIFLDATAAISSLLGSTLNLLLPSAHGRRCFSFLDASGNFEQCLAELYMYGVDLHWQALYEDTVAQRRSLPTPQFESNACWTKRFPVQAETTVSGWFHQMVWKQSSFSKKMPGRDLRTMVLISSGSSLGSQIRAVIEEQGMNCITVQYGDRFAKCSDSEFVINPSLPTDRTAFRDNVIEVHKKVDGIIFIHDTDYRKTSATECLLIAGDLTSSLFDMSQTFTPWFTKGFVVANVTSLAAGDHEGPDPFQVATTGFFRALQAEYAGLRIKNIDVASPGLSSAGLLANIVNEIVGEEPLTDIALRDGKKYTFTLDRLPIDTTAVSRTLSFKVGDVYIITGGAEGIGFELARTIAAWVESTFIILGRTKLDIPITGSGAKPNQKAAHMDLLREMGSAVEYYAVDVADPEGMKKVFDKIQTRHRKIKGVFHGAGTGISGVPFSHRKKAEFENIIRPKVYGTLLLDALVTPLQPEYLVCFSSLNVIIPSKGSVDYTMANSFMDGLCACRSASGVKYISIQWPGWKDVGMILKKEITAVDDSDAPIKLLAPANGIEALLMALTTPKSTVSVANMDYGFFIGNPYFHPQAVHEQYTKEVKIHSLPRVPEPLAPALTSIEQSIIDIWKTVLKVDNVRLNDDFFDLGGNSLNGAQVIRKINASLDVNIDFDEIFEYGTLKQLSDRITTIRSEKMVYEAANAIKPAAAADHYTLSHAQKRLWVLSQFEEDSIAYNLPAAYQIEQGSFDTLAFEKAVNVLVARHEGFRTIFRLIDGEPRQVIIAELSYKVPIIDLSDSSRDTLARQTKYHYQQEVSRPFNLETGPLFSFKVVKQTSDRYLIIYNIHHIISDGWSQGVITNDLLKAYNIFKTGGTPEFQPLRLQYKDYSEWHNNLIATGYFNKLENYWMTKFADKPSGIDLPFDRVRPAVQTFNGGRVLFKLDQLATGFLHEAAKQKGTTIFMNILSVLGILLYKYSGQKDIIIGSPSAGRSQEEFQEIIGFFVNTLVYRWSIDPEDNFYETLRKVKSDALDVYNHMEYPFDLMVERVGLERSLSHSPLFNVMLAHNNTSREETDLSMADADVDTYEEVHEFNMSKFDLIFFMADGPSGIHILLEYNSDLFDRATILRMSQNFVALANHIAAHPSVPIREMDCLSPMERNLVTEGFKGKEVSFAHNTVLSLFQDRVKDHPDGVAVAFGGEAISYHELNSRANQLAHYLVHNYNARRGSLIGLSVQRSIDIVVAILAIIKSGAGYVAIDPGYPIERQVHMLDDSQTGLLLTDLETQPFTKNYNGAVLNLIDHNAVINDMPVTNLPLVNSLDDIIYVIYTSGSTGMPNGAMLSHGLLSNLVQWQLYSSGIDNSLNTLQFTSVNFCVSFQEIMVTLCAGGKVCLIGDLERQDPDFLMRYIEEHEIGNLYLPFSYLNFLFNEFDRWQTRRHALKNIITAGEQLKITPGLKKFLTTNPEIRLYNHYGSSEMHVVTSFELNDVDKLETSVPPVGKPIDNTVILILDEFLNPVPIGVFGELFAQGSTDVAGYINNDSLTGKKMFTISYAGQPQKRFYRSGDTGRWLHDGNIELKGRKDSQVKVRGFRVELGEVESKIYQVKHVRECVVVVREEKDQKDLIAYVVLDDPTHIATVKDFLALSLPNYMIPVLVVLQALPLMPNGKVDRDKLPPPPKPDKSDVFEPLVGDTEHALHPIWCEVLGHNAIGATDNFFEIGGHSIKASQVVNRIQKNIKVKVTLFHLFRNPTLRLLAGFIDKQESVGPLRILPSEIKPYYAASEAQTRLWIADQYQANVQGTYNMRIAYEIQGSLRSDLLEKSFVALIHRHEALRTCFLEKNGKVYQRVLAPREVQWSLLHESSEEADDVAQSVMDKPFVLNTAPLLRAVLITVRPDHFFLAIAIHHIISDGWSLNILVNELLLHYNSLTATGNLHLNQELSIQYKDYAEWMASRSHSGAFQESRAYWMNKLQGVAPHAVELPGDFPRPQRRSYAGANMTANLGVEIVSALKAIAVSRNTSVYNIVVAALTVIVHRNTNAEDIVLGAEIHGREDPELERVVGFFVNTVLLRNHISPRQTLAEVIDQVTKVSLDALEHQHYSLDWIKNDLDMDYIPNKNPLFNIEVSYTFNFVEANDMELAGTSSWIHQQASTQTHFDMTISLYEELDNVNINIIYNKEIFRPTTIGHYHDQLTSVLQAIASDVDQPVETLSLMAREAASSGLDVHFNF